MAFDVKEIKASIDKHSYLRTHSYDIQMNVPAIMQTSRLRITNELAAAEVDQSLLDMPRIIQVRAEETLLPGGMILTADNQRWGIGPSMKNPTNVLFTDTNVTFLADRYGMLWSFFYLWKQSIFTWDQVASGEGALVPSYRMQYRKVKKNGTTVGNYVTDIIITVYDMTNVPRLKFKLIEAYPTMVPATPIAWGNNDQLLKLRVNFTFQRWEMMDISEYDVGAAPLPTTIDQWNRAISNSTTSAETPDVNFAVN